MSRIDYITITLVGICLCVLVYVLVKISGLNGENPPEINPNDSLKTQVIQPVDTNDLVFSDTLERIPEQSSDSLLSTPVEPNEVTKNEVSENLDFLVVAASFNNRPDAEKELKRLQTLGYSNAEIGLFNAGKIISVITGRYASYSEAQQQVNTLQKDRNIKAYVHQKRR